MFGKIFSMLSGCCNHENSSLLVEGQGVVTLRTSFTVSINAINIKCHINNDLFLHKQRKLT